MIYVSLLVHEQPLVVANQLCNFKRFLPGARVVIHISPSATFSPTELQETLSSQQLDNHLVNQERVPSAWGSIIQAHLANIRLISTLGRPDDRVVFHSSNDMLVRDGLEQHLNSHEHLFNERPVTKPGHWWVGETALRDTAFRELRHSIGADRIVASQIEGSMYRLDVLRELERILSSSAALASDVFYPREEIMFSTLARAMGVQADARPYIFSSIHRFDRRLWSYFDLHPWFFGSKLRFAKSVKKRVNKRLFASDVYHITPADVDRIIAQQPWPDTELTLDDGGGDGPWRTNDTPDIFGVKRVERSMTDPLRRYISTLP